MHEICPMYNKEHMTFAHFRLDNFPAHNNLQLGPFCSKKGSHYFSLCKHYMLIKMLIEYANKNDETSENTQCTNADDELIFKNKC